VINRIPVTPPESPQEISVPFMAMDGKKVFGMATLASKRRASR
jgi:hypothetical protein